MKVHSECSCRKAGFQVPEDVPNGLLNEEWARRNHDQSLAELNRRGGLTIEEMLAIIARRGYHSLDAATANARLYYLIYGYKIGLNNDNTNRSKTAG